MNPGDLLVHLFIREDENGCWLWKGSLTGMGYAQLSVNGVQMANLHRHFWEHYVCPLPEKAVIDHLCGVKRCVNPMHMQAVTQTENCEHRPQLNKNNTSGYRGVTWCKRAKKWKAQVYYQGKNYFAGEFHDKEHAAQAAVNKRNQLFSNNLDDRAL